MITMFMAVVYKGRDYKNIEKRDVYTLFIETENPSSKIIVYFTFLGCLTHII